MEHSLSSSGDRRPQQAQQQDGVVGPPPTSSNPKPEKHRRSKSAMVSNFLSAPSHVAKSAKNKLSSSNGGVGSDRSSSAHSRAGSFTTASPNSSLNHLSADEREGRGQQRQKANAATSTATGTTATTTATMSGSSAIGSDNPAAAATRSSMTSDRPPSANTTAKTVEETVRTFRLYEALRNGDTAGISRAIREGTQYADRQGSVASVATSSTSATADKAGILNLAVQCAELPVIEYILSTTSRDRASTSNPYLDVNHADPATGNTPLHVAAQLGRLDVVQLLLKQEGINDAIVNHRNQTPLDVARKSSVYGMLQLARNLYLEDVIEKVHGLVERHEYENLEALLESPRVKGLLDINTIDPPNAPGSTLLHEAARKKDLKLIQSLLLHGADPFRRDKRGKLPQDVTKDDTTRAVLKKSPAAMAAARGIEEKAVLAGAAEFAVHHGQGGQDAGAGGSVAGKESREMKGYLKKWTNYTSGYKLRWFVLEDGVLSYYKNQDDIGSACRGAINMRIAKLYMDPQDKLRFEILGKGSVKYHLKANHEIEAKRWFWTLNNAIQQAKDDAREEERQKQQDSERMGRLREKVHQQDETASMDASRYASKAESITSETAAASKHGKSSIRTASNDASNEKLHSFRTDMEFGAETAAEDDDDDDDSSTSPKEPPSDDVLTLAAHSARLQIDLLSQVVLALQFENANNPDLKVSDSTVVAAMASYSTAVESLKSLINDLINMGRDRDEYWRYRLDKEIRLRKIWEDNMTKLAQDQEELEDRVYGERERRKKTKRALQKILTHQESKLQEDGKLREHVHSLEQEEGVEELDEKLKDLAMGQERSRQELEREIEAQLSDTDSDESDEFFDAVDAGEVEVIEMPLTTVKSPTLPPQRRDTEVEKEGDEEFEEADEELEEASDGPALWQKKVVAIKSSYHGYEDPPRARLAMDEDNRPKISLWGILKSMIGKDMTKMTLPVSFNEPTSLLQRVAEDMEYTDLLDTAATRLSPAERMVYVAAFAASEYASTTLRVAKPFNPLLGETFEYVRPDKKYRFFVEQVSHHPPIGAAYAEAEKWDYWGESAVKSKFYGKSFEINPLGTWFLRLRPVTGGEELYTWKKVTTSVVGIITGSPTVDNYGLMEIKNHTTGDICHLDFKQRGWSAKNAYEVKGAVKDPDGNQTWSVGGRWNDKLYARLSPGYDANISPPASTYHSQPPTVASVPTDKAFLVWGVNPRPSAPFNLTPFAITLNALPENLKPYLCPTDTRLRPDQRAMENGEYDFAAEEKNRVEEKQRAKRRERDERGDGPWEPRWFRKGVEETTGEECWVFGGEYWKLRERVVRGETKWEEEGNRIEDIF